MRTWKWPFLATEQRTTELGRARQVESCFKILGRMKDMCNTILVHVSQIFVEKSTNCKNTELDRFRRIKISNSHDKLLYSYKNKNLFLLCWNFLSSQIPVVLGYIDGTHIAIKGPAEDENLFYNRKAFHSINAMIVAIMKICDSDMKIMHCFNRFGGSTHDAYIWNESPIKRDLMGVWASGEQCWLLGDSGHPHQPWLQTPILNARAGSPEAKYKAMHVRARSTVERCIGLLKGRFHCLLRSYTLEYAPVKYGRIINAAVMLHNMCISGELPEIEIPVEEEVVAYCLPQEEGQREDLLQEARVVRERIINRLNV